MGSLPGFVKPGAPPRPTDQPTLALVAVSQTLFSLTRPTTTTIKTPSLLFLSLNLSPTQSVVPPSVRGSCCVFLLYHGLAGAVSTLGLYHYSFRLLSFLSPSLSD